MNGVGIICSDPYYWAGFIDFFKNIDMLASARNLSDCLPYQQCDLVIGAIAISNSRMILVDFSHGYLHWSIAFFIPIPNSASRSRQTISNSSIDYSPAFNLSICDSQGWISANFFGTGVDRNFSVIPCVFAAFYFSHKFRRRIPFNNPLSYSHHSSILHRRSPSKSR